MLDHSLVDPWRTQHPNDIQFSWDNKTSGTTNDLWAVEFGNGEFLAGGTNIVIKSNDGITWTQILSRTVQGIGYVEFDVQKWKYSPTPQFTDLR